jgi:cytochrome P450
MMRALPVDPATGWTAPTDLQVLFFRLTIDSATEFLFGESVDSQIAELPENRLLNITKDPTRDEKLFAHAFDTGQSYLAMRARFQDRYWLIYNAEFRRSCKLVHAFVDYYVELALSSDLSSAEKGQSSSKTEKYTFLTALAASTRDPIELRTQLLNILLAGRDTTAGLLGWLFHHLIRHPDVFAKLRAAIIDDFGSYEHPRDISFARLKSCAYLQHCLSETLRINPVVPINSRKATRDTTIPRGGGPSGSLPLYVKKGQQVDYSVHVMHQRKDLWGSDAEEWKPERWAGRKTGWEYLPFNGGPRICIGQQFALTEAGYVAVRLLQRFGGVESLEGGEQARHNVTLTSHNGNGVRVRLRRA